MSNRSRHTIPIQQDPFSILETEFANMHKSFEDAMRQMDEEMKSLWPRMLNWDSNALHTTAAPPVGHSSTARPLPLVSGGGSASNVPAALPSSSGRRGSVGGQLVLPVSNSATAVSARTPSGANAVAHRNIMNDLLNSSLVVDNEGGGKKLQLRFDVSKFAPHEVEVRTSNDRLLVHAKHEEKDDNHCVRSEYRREFWLPSGVGKADILTSLSADGVLTVAAPLSTEYANTLLAITKQ